MPVLSLLRHAKSSWDDPGLSDFDRPLAARGRDAAPRVGQWMGQWMAQWTAQTGAVPDLVLCSTARRTRETLDLIAPFLRVHPPVVFEEGLYHAEAPALLRRLQGLQPPVRHALLIGHNPGLHELALTLIGEADAAELRALSAKLPTAGFAALVTGGSTWSSLRSRSCRLAAFMTPKRLPDA